MNGLLLRPLTLQDKQAIEQWPEYPAEFSALDHALRANGWLDEFHGKPGNWSYAAEFENTPVAFSLLLTTSKQEAEFRIALHPHCLGQGLGKSITLATLAAGFNEIGLQRIHLIVRKNNLRAIRLYEGTGFNHCGECTRTVNGKNVAFYEMECFRKTQEILHG